MTVKGDYKRAEDLDGEGGSTRKSWFFNTTVFTILCCLGNVAYAGHIAYLGGAISMIEKRFQMRSAQSGLFFTVNDVVGLCTALFVTHFGQKGNRPRIICILYMLFASGALISAVPNFLFDLPLALRVGSNVGVNGSSIKGNRQIESITCDAETNVQNAACDEERTSQSGALINEAWWIFLGQAMAGLSSAAGPLIITFLDDNQKKKNTPVLIGLIFSSWTIGIVFGFFLANFCLRLPVTFPNIDPETTVLDPRDPRFLGAWWLGLMICAVIIIVVTFPLFFFPRKLPGSPADEEGKSADIEGDKHTKEFIAGVGAVKDFVQAFKRIVTNMTVIPLVLSTCCGLLSFVGLRAFGTKYLHTQFDVPTSQASLLTGVIIIPCAIFGNVTGGFIVKKFNFQKRGMVTMALILSSSSLLIVPLFLLAGCPQKMRAGLSIPYSVHNATTMASFDLPNLDASCNTDCECPTTYRPVCGSDGISYASPCHAGCTGEVVLDSDGYHNVTVFTDCNCIPSSDNLGAPYANHGECSQDCSFGFHVSLGLLLSTLISLATAPTALLKMRCVDDRDRSLVLGFTNVMTKLVAYIPGPVLWGALIDKACVLFQESCDQTGYCMVYDTDKFRTIYYSNVIVIKLLDLICLCIGFAAIIYGHKKAKEYLAMKPHDVVNVNGTREGDEIPEDDKGKKEQLYTTV